MNTITAISCGKKSPQENNSIVFHFYASKWYLPFGMLIKAKTNSMHDHVSIEVTGEGIYQASFLKGVTKSDKSKRDPVFSVIFPFDKNSEKGGKYLKFLDSQVGKGYDYKAILFGFWGLKCESDDRWYCSELTDTFFSVYLEKKSVIKTTVSPKVFLAKIESFAFGCLYEK